MKSKLYPILLKFGHINRLNMRNSKMEFANHFAKIHVTCWHQITETVNVSRFLSSFFDKSSFLIHI